MHWCPLLLLLLCVGPPLPPVSAQEAPLILPPSKESPVEAVVLIAPGAYINYLYYEPLGLAIQAASPYKVWVGLIGPFVSDIATPGGCATHIEELLSSMSGMGMNSSNLFVSGHSLGGASMQTWILDNLDRTTAMVLLASEVTASWTRQVNYTTLPILQVSGDLDGIVMVPEVEPIFRELQDYMSTEGEDLALSNPVVLLPDINHMQFASGPRPPAVEDHDILSPLTEAEAHSMLALHIAAFMAVSLEEGEVGYVQGAREVMLQDHQDTKRILKSLEDIHAYTATRDVDYPYSTYAEEAQGKVSRVEDEDLLQVTDTLYDSLTDLANSRASFEVLNDTVAVYTCSLVNDLRNDNINEPVVNPEEVAVKMKSYEALYEPLDGLGATFLDVPPVTCRDINQMAIDTALSFASDKVKQRFSSRGKPFTLLDDLLLSTGSQWLDSHVLLNFTLQGLEVQSPTLLTSIEAPLGLDGAHYCKLLSPDRALEYILVDSLRRTQP